MYLEDAVRIIQKHWLSGVAAAVPGLATVFDNEAAPGASTYARLAITSMPTSQQTMGGVGNRRVQRNGMIQVKLNGPPDEGRKGVDAYVRHVNAILEMVSLPASVPDDGVWTDEASPRELGSDGQYWTLMLLIPFRFWEMK